MKKEYTVSARSARPVGSIGQMRPMTVRVMAESKEDALIEAYEQMEHIHKPIIRLERKHETNSSNSG